MVTSWAVFTDFQESNFILYEKSSLLQETYETCPYGTARD
jgi:hypothetical protein